MAIKRETIQGLFIGTGLIFLSTLIILYIKHIDIIAHRPAPPFRIMGDKNAKIHIEEFTDFECPACSAANTITKKLFKAFKGDIKVSFKHYPLSMNQWSFQAAIHADCAGKQGKFWKYSDLLFENQRTWIFSKKLPKEFIAYAKKINLNMPEFDKCVINPETLKEIKLNKAEGRMLGINATPTFFINGKRAVGATQLINSAKKFEYLLKK